MDVRQFLPVLLLGTVVAVCAGLILIAMLLSGFKKQ
jgi:hypothetical protein